MTDDNQYNNTGCHHLLALVCFHVIDTAEVSPRHRHTLYVYLDNEKKNEADGDDAEVLKHR